MANISESLINVVTLNKPKVLKGSTRGRRLGPKGEGPGIGAYQSPIVDEASPAERRSLSHSNRVLSWNTSATLSAGSGKPVGLPADGHSLGKASRKACRWVCG
jgi:hypothetical protein